MAMSQEVGWLIGVHGVSKLRRRDHSQSSQWDYNKRHCVILHLLGHVIFKEHIFQPQNLSRSVLACKVSTVVCLPLYYNKINWILHVLCVLLFSDRVHLNSSLAELDYLCFLLREAGLLSCGQPIKVVQMWPSCFWKKDPTLTSLDRYKNSTQHCYLYVICVFWNLWASVIW